MITATLALTAALLTGVTVVDEDEVLVCVNLGLDLDSDTTVNGNDNGLGGLLDLGGLLKLDDCGGTKSQSSLL